MKKTIVVTSLILMNINFVQAQTSVPAEPETQGWSHESEASAVSVNGNSQSESYSAKQKTAYTWNQHSVVAAGRYVETINEYARISKAWEMSGRYEWAASDLWSAYVGHGAEHDEGAGFIQRDNSDIGIKYVIRKTEKESWLTELGYRYSKTYTTLKEEQYASSGRFYMQYTREFDKNLSITYWIEYLPNFKKSSAYLINSEPSLNMMLTDIFSIKLAYLIKYQNEPLLPATKNKDTTFTTSLVARF